MPGYGFAAAPKDKVKAWTRMIHDYLRGRANLARVYVLIDARHGLKDADAPALDALGESAVSHQIVLTKADQVKASELQERIAAIESSAEEAPGRVSECAADLVARRRRNSRIARGHRAAEEGAKLILRLIAKMTSAIKKGPRRNGRRQGPEELTGWIVPQPAHSDYVTARLDRTQRRCTSVQNLTGEKLGRTPRGILQNLNVSRG